MSETPIASLRLCFEFYAFFSSHSLLFCFVTMIFWCIFAVFAPSIEILSVVVVVVITSCSWAQSSFLVWYHLSMREKKVLPACCTSAYVCVSLCECTFVVAFFGKIQVENIIQKALNPNAFSLSVLKRYGKNECGNLKRIIEWIYVQ